MVAPVYPAGEEAIDGVNSEALVARIRPAATVTRAISTGPQAIAPVVARSAKPGDFVVFLGAGNITQWAYALPKELGGEIGMIRKRRHFSTQAGRTSWAGCAGA